MLNRHRLHVGIPLRGISLPCLSLDCKHKYLGFEIGLLLLSRDLLELLLKILSELPALLLQLSHIFRDLLVLSEYFFHFLLSKD
jgi:hypothetical protein